MKRHQCVAAGATMGHEPLESLVRPGRQAASVVSAQQLQQAKHV